MKQLLETIKKGTRDGSPDAEVGVGHVVDGVALEVRVLRGVRHAESLQAELGRPFGGQGAVQGAQTGGQVVLAHTH